MKESLSYLIVLGAHVRPNGPCRSLRYRLDTACEYLKRNPSTICIVSGGQGDNEPATEAEIMCQYLVQKGISPNRILQEDRSRNTLENLRFSTRLMHSGNSSLGIVTNHYHMFRSLLIAKDLGLKQVQPLGAPQYKRRLPLDLLREAGALCKYLFFNSCRRSS